jgi:chromosome segregation ATPase
MTPAKSINIQQAETDIAVLQVQVENIEEKVSDIKADLKHIQTKIEEHAATQVRLMSSMQDASENAHKSLSDKISALEKWRWMMMGAGVVIGSLGFDTLSKLLK